MIWWFNSQIQIESQNQSACAQLLTEHFCATSIPGVDVRHWKSLASLNNSALLFNLLKWSPFAAILCPSSSNFLIMGLPYMMLAIFFYFYFFPSYIYFWNWFMLWNKLDLPYFMCFSRYPPACHSFMASTRRRSLHSAASMAAKWRTALDQFSGWAPPSVVLVITWQVSGFCLDILH